MKAGVISLVIVAASVASSGQSNPQQNSACKPKLVRDSKSEASQDKTQHTFEGYRRAPIISFEVDESGKILNGKIKRGSGSPAADKYALDEVRHMRYKPRAGCGTIESEATITIDLH